MTITRSLRGRLVAVASVATVLLTATPPAQAFTTYTPTGGPAVNLVGTGISLTDIPNGQTITCASFTMAGGVSSPGLSRAYPTPAVNLPTLASAGCTNTLWGPVTFALAPTWRLAMTGDPSGGLWPARLSQVKISGTIAGCAIEVTGVVDGTFAVGSQRFTPGAGPSGLGVTAAVGGAPCVAIDVVVGDPVAVGGYWTNTAMPPLALANP